MGKFECKMHATPSGRRVLHVVGTSPHLFGGNVSLRSSAPSHGPNRRLKAPSLNSTHLTSWVNGPGGALGVYIYICLLKCISTFLISGNKFREEGQWESELGPRLSLIPTPWAKNVKAVTGHQFQQDCFWWENVCIPQLFLQYQ